MGLRTREPNSVVVSAYTGKGIEQLVERIAQLLPRPEVMVDLILPYSRGDLLARVHEDGDIEILEYVEAGTHLRARVHPGLASALTGSPSW